MGFTTLFLLIFSSCESPSDKHTQTSATDSAIIAIDNVDQFNKIWEKSEEHLIMLEFYADWCPSCKELAPVLEKIARENRDKVTVYKINTDRNSELAYSFRVSGIPHVVFIKNKENVFSLSGVYPQNMYLRIIDQFSGSVTRDPDTPDKEVDAEQAT
jgi:putative thioredoxin